MQSLHALATDTLFYAPWSSLPSVTYLVLTLVILTSLELINQFLLKFYSSVHSTTFVPVRGKHLDTLSTKDWFFITVNKLQIPPFIYLLLHYCHTNTASVPWELDELTLSNTLLPIPLLFIVYDLFYSLFHRFLHIKQMYVHIHKHHHHQKAPSRGNLDAVNVHPFEFFGGEYCHWWALYLLNQAGLPVHILTIKLFLLLGGIFATLNHTRFDLNVTLANVRLYCAAAHDVHHRVPLTNYGQYIMLWDWVLGTYKPYNKEERWDKSKQLDKRAIAGGGVLNRKLE